MLDALSEPEIEAYKSLNKTSQERLQRKIRAAYGEDVDAVSIPHAVMPLCRYAVILHKFCKSNVNLYLLIINFQFIHNYLQLRKCQ